MSSFGFPMDTTQSRLFGLDKGPGPGPGVNEQYCSGCAKVISIHASTCPGCGAPIRAAAPVNASDKSRLAAMLLCLFLGVFGVHRFYVGKFGTALLQSCTLGFFGVWTLIDFILIISGAFSDTEGRKLLIWTE